MGEAIALAVLINVVTNLTVGWLTPEPERKPVQIEIVNEYECKVEDIIVK